MKLIDKDALVAEIEKYYKEYSKRAKTYIDDANYWTGKADAYRYILTIIDTLEVKELLTWQDIRLISEIGEDFMNSEESDNLNEEEYYQSILNKFKAQKGE